MKNDFGWMQEALLLAKQGLSSGEVPVGAVLVSERGILLGGGFNQVISNHDPSAHAEIVAMRAAGYLINNYRLKGCTLYTTLEPCCMCAGAMVNARIKRVVFATRDFKSGAAGSLYNLLSGYPLNHKIQIDEGILQYEAAQILSSFFQSQR